MESINIDKIIDYIAEGNFTVIFLTLVSTSLLLWIKYEKSIKNLVYFLRNLNNKGAQLEKQKEANALEIRIKLFLERINLKIAYIEALKLATDPGRNALYHYLINTLLVMMKEDFLQSYHDFKDGKLKPDLFCSYSGYHQQRLVNLKQKYEDEVKKRLKEEGWDDEHISYVFLIFSQWMAQHISLLSELISTCHQEEGVIMSWWIFYYDIYTTLNKFSILINGKITGLYFENIKIGRPSRRK